MARSIALLCFVLVGAVCASTAAAAGGENGGRLVNAVYVFGDSLVDVGNNDYLPAPAPRANRPYGMDLPGRPTGRFTNGYNLADVISQRLGFEMSPKPYLSMLPHDKILLGLCKIGANYASGGSGILDTTGKGTLTMRTQVQYFKKAADNMICYPSKEEHLARSLFLLSGGGNDFSAFDPSTASPQAYVVKMVTTYIEHIQALYDMGARMAFNSLLKAKLAEAAAATMKELKYSVAANYNILNEMMDNSLVAGLRREDGVLRLREAQRGVQVDDGMKKTLVSKPEKVTMFAGVGVVRGISGALGLYQKIDMVDGYGSEF
ncbi:hypothetical protein ZWY2020_000147 [Hordeum vulgare]|nr:hypothetical protein ZWY2020_000147 [Hordeum vulgare]